MAVDDAYNIDKEYLADRLIFSVRFECPNIVLSDLDYDFVPVDTEKYALDIRKSQPERTEEEVEVHNELESEAITDDTKPTEVHNELETKIDEQPVQESGPDEEVSLNLEVEHVKKSFADLEEKVKGYSTEQMHEMHSKYYSGKLDKNPVEKIKALYIMLYLDVTAYIDWLEFGGADPSWTDGSNINLIVNHITHDVKNIIRELDEDYSSLIPVNVPDNYMVLENPRTLNRLKNFKYWYKTVSVKGDAPGEFIERDINEVITELEVKENTLVKDTLAETEVS